MRGRYPTKYLADGSLNPAWKPRPRKPGLAEKNFFVAWDGEGVTVGDNHYYNLLMAAWRDERAPGGFTYRLIRAKNGRLTTRQILKFIHKVLLEIPQQAIHIGFSLNYDFTHMLYDMPWLEVKYALHNSRRVCGFFDGVRVKVRPRKELQIWYPEHRKAGRKEKWRHYFHLWDVFGFFQTSYIAAITKWLGKEYADLPLIRRGKALRGEEQPLEDVIAYCLAELKGLIVIAEALNQAFLEMDFRLSRWDGPGAAAAVAFRKYMPKNWFVQAREPMADDPELYQAIRCAYFGGRVELVQYGSYQGSLYQYDINSAYPHAMRRIPDLSNGVWRRVEPVLTDNLMTLYHVRWDFTDRVICPFPLRMPGGSVIFAERGEGWYWQPEVAAAQAVIDRDRGRRGTSYNYAGCQMMLLDAYEFVPASDRRPFAWIEDLYQRRLQAIADGQNGLQLAIKLVINSLYGKTAQQVGYTPQIEHIKDYETGDVVEFFNEKATIPPYYNLAIAGVITATTRAMLFAAASQKPQSVILMMTDGIACTEVLDLDTPSQKILGAWEKTVSEQVEAVYVQAGVVFLHDGRLWKEKSRGFTAAGRPEMSFEEGQYFIEQRARAVQSGWRDGLDSIWLSTGRLISIKAAASGEKTTPTWEKRGTFQTDEPRELKLWPPASATKRVMIERGRPWNTLVMTMPRSPLYDEYPLSQAYKAIPLDENPHAQKREEFLEYLDYLEHA